MTRVWVPLALLAIALAGLLGFELRSGLTNRQPRNQGRPAIAELPVAGAAESGTPASGVGVAAQRQILVDAILARPLFSPNRRAATAHAAEPGAPPPTLARVTGIIVDGGRRTVFFAGSDGGKPIAVGEGAELKGYRVTSIEAAQVTVTGPNGSVVLRPAFDPTPPQARTSVLGLPGLSLPNLTGIPGLNAPVAPLAR
jgi:hypothetical protein